MNGSPSCPLETLIFHVTNLCNLKCIHCWQHAVLEAPQNESYKNRGVVSQADFVRVLKEAKDLGAISVKFTGGEPFIHPYINDYLEIADHENLSVVIETNGTLLEEDHIRRLKRINQLKLSVSLDGATSAIHDQFRGVEGAYDRTVATLDLLARFGIPVQVIMCLHKGNLKEFEDFFRLLAQYRVNSLKINPVQPSGRGQDLVEQNHSVPVDELLQVADYCRKSLSAHFAGRLFFSLPLAFRPFKEIRDQEFSICQIFHILGLLPNGDLSFCGIGNIESSLVLGNIYKDNLADLWFKAPLLVKMRELLPQALTGVCSQCILNAVCLGECRAVAYEQTGDLTGAYWICQQAYEAGLFPATRLKSSPTGEN